MTSLSSLTSLTILVINNGIIWLLYWPDVYCIICYAGPIMIDRIIIIYQQNRFEKHNNKSSKILKIIVLSEINVVVGRDCDHSANILKAFTINNDLHLINESETDHCHLLQQEHYATICQNPYTIFISIW